MARAAVILAAAAVAAVAAPPARADGLPVLGADSGTHRVTSGSGATYGARPARRTTTVEKVSPGAGGTLRVTIPGRFVVPVVAYDGAASGLSADGRTLVLIRPRTQFPERATTLAILDAGSLRVERFVHMRRDVSFDAISRDGHWVYLIDYTSKVDPTHYAVRAMDAGTGRLLRRAIVDPHEPDEAMRGNPLARVTSADGRWAYTLYDGNGHPFVHALDTSRLSARCIDVPAFPANANPFDGRIGIAPDRRHLLITMHGRTLAMLDTTTLRVTIPGHGAAARSSDRHDSAGTVGIAFPIAVAVLLLGAGLVVLRRRAVRPT
ncbi:MAG TPA: hypothetical protein VGI87_01910 [Solirubrobacteraceae bacterium]|jgi:hypothetical protein